MEKIVTLKEVRDWEFERSGGRGTCRKLCFIVNVVEIDGKAGVDEVAVEVDPKEHSEFKWVARDEVGGLDVTNEAMREVIDCAFDVWAKK